MSEGAWKSAVWVPWPHSSKVDGPVYAPANVSELCAPCGAGDDDGCMAVFVGHACAERVRWRPRCADCGHGALQRLGDLLEACSVCGRVEAA